MLEGISVERSQTEERMREREYARETQSRTSKRRWDTSKAGVQLRQEHTETHERIGGCS